MRNLTWLFLFSACSDTKPMKKGVTTPFAVSVADRSDGTPLADARVAVDDKNGKRVEGSTDATGVATLQIDWTQAPMAVTAYAPGHALTTSLGVAQNATWKTSLPQNGAPPTGTTIMGNILHKDMDSDYVTLSASVHAGYFQDGTSTYSLEIFDDKPFSIYALDWVASGPKTPSKRGIQQTFVKWAQVDAPTPTAGASFDVDFAAGTALTPVRQSGTLVIPANSQTALGQSIGYITVTDDDSGLSSFLGAPLFIDVAADGQSFAYDLELVQPANITHPLTQYSLATASGSYTVKVDPAWPTDGAKVNDLLDVATVTKSPLPINLLSEAPTFQAPGGDSDSFLVIESNNGKPTQKFLWYVYGPAGTPLVTPQPPTGASLDEVLPPASLSGVIVACSPAQASRCTRYSVSEPFALTR